MLLGLNERERERKEEQEEMQRREGRLRKMCTCQRKKSEQAENVDGAGERSRLRSKAEIIKKPT